MKPIEIIAQDLFDKVRSRFTNLQMGDEKGSVTVNPQDARFFDFDFTIESHDLGRVSISINDTGNLKVYYSQSITENTDTIAQEVWYNFLKEMRFFAKRRLLRFDTRDITKGNLEKSDFQYLAKNGSKDKNMKESNMFGSSKTSHRRLEDTDLIIRHTEAIDPTKPGARSRKIKNLFIQNKEGERFKFPFVYLPGARAMQRHISNGGYPHDDAGKNIVKTCEEILKLSDFGRKVKHSTLNDNAHAIAERAGQKLQQLRHHMECMSKQGYYESWREAYKPDDAHLIELDAATVESYKDAFTVNKFDEALAEMFPLLHSIMQEASEVDLEEYVGEAIEEDSEKVYCDNCGGELRDTGASWNHVGHTTCRTPKPIDETTESQDVFSTFESWAEGLVSESFSDDEIAQLQELVKEPLLVGSNEEAVQALMGIGIKDPGLINALKAIADMPNGADADARDTIKTYMGNDADKIDWGDIDKSTPQSTQPTAPEPTAPTEPEQGEEMPTQPSEQPPAEDEEAANEEQDDESFLAKMRKKVGMNKEDSIETDPKHKLIEPDSINSKLKDVAKVIMGFYDRDRGTWTKGEHGVVTHVKRQFSSDSGKGGEKEAKLAAKLIKHLNSQHEGKKTFEEIRKLAGLSIYEDVTQDHDRNTFQHICNRFKKEVADFKHDGTLDQELYEALFDYYEPEMPYGIKKARTGDPKPWISDRFAEDLGMAHEDIHGEFSEDVFEMRRLAGLSVNESKKSSKRKI